MTEVSRVRSSTPPAINQQIDRESMQRLRHYAGRDRAELRRRMRALEREWDIERALELHAAAIGLAGLVLGVKRDRRWLVLPAAVLSFLAQHAIRGRCPPVSLLRRLGVRTRREIERERYALKALAGDFEGASGRSQAAWRAVRD